MRIAEFVDTMRRRAGRCERLPSVLLGLALLFFTTMPAAAQTGTVTGLVVGGTTGEPLPDVQVQVEGTDIGQVTNGQGRFLLLNVPAGQHTLVTTLIGFGQERVDVTVTAGGSTDVGTLQMYTQAVELEGMVVTGTAIAAQRREVGNSIALITSEDIEASGVTSMEDVLRGKALGVMVQGSSGVAGAGSQILLRGIGSLYGRNRPLIYVDGVRLNDRGAYETSGSTGEQAATVLNSINPGDIDRIEIIKGAAASTLYGTEASAGVIQIFTKKGTQGQRRWTFSAEGGVGVPVHVGPDSDPTGLHINDCTIGGPLRPDQTAPDPGCPASGSWLKNAWHQEYRLDVRGGGESFNYFAAGSWSNQQGIYNVPPQYDPQQAQDINLRANFTFNPFETLQIRVNNAYTRRDISWVPDGDNSRGFMENVIKLDEGETPNNVDSLVFQQSVDQSIDHYTTGLNLNWQPLDNFQHRLNVGLDWSESLNLEFRPFGYWDYPDGSRTHDTENSRVITVDYAGSWSSQLPGTWTSTLSWGGQLNDREDRGLRADCVGFVAPGERVLNECRRSGFEGGGLGLQEDRRGFRNGGGFLQEQIGWNNRLFVTAGLRVDGFSQINSELDLNYKFLTFPKLQATYTLSDHDFWPRDWFETFRLRAAWGQSGDPPPQDATQTLWQIAGADELPGSGFIIESIANPDVEAERTTEWEAGVDASFFNGRVSLQGTGFYNKTTKGILYNPLLPSDGVVENIPVNTGSWEAKGIETALDLTVVESNSLRLSVNGKYQWYDNKLLSLGELGEGDPQVLYTSFNQRYVEGKPFPQFWGEPISNPDEEALPQRDTLQDLGRSIPNQELSLGVTASLGSRLTLDVFGSGQFGHVLLDESAEEAASDGVWPECVQPDGRTVDQQILDYFNAGGTLDGLTARRIAQCGSFNSIGGVPIDDYNEDWLFSGNYFRIQSASLSYRVPEAWLPQAFTGGTIQFRVTNLALFTDYPTGNDPDALLGGGLYTLFRSGGYTLPAPRTYSLNLRVNF